jgi:hypothetical protein
MTRERFVEKQQRCSKKSVRFASPQRLEDEYLIQSRDCQEKSVSVEEFYNRVYRLEQQVQSEQNEVFRLDLQAVQLQEEIGELRKFQEITEIIELKKTISALKSRSLHLNEEMKEMRIKTLRNKSKAKLLLKELKETETDKSLSTIDVARKLWERATGARQTFTSRPPIAKCA